MLTEVNEACSGIWLLSGGIWLLSGGTIWIHYRL